MAPILLLTYLNSKSLSYQCCPRIVKCSIMLYSSVLCSIFAQRCFFKMFEMQHGTWITWRSQMIFHEFVRIDWSDICPTKWSHNVRQKMKWFPKNLIEPKKKVVKTEAITYMDTLLIRLFTAQELFNGVKVLKLGIQAICQENSRQIIPLPYQN